MTGVEFLAKNYYDSFIASSRFYSQQTQRARGLRESVGCPLTQTKPTFIAKKPIIIRCTTFNNELLIILQLK